VVEVGKPPVSAGGAANLATAQRARKTPKRVRNIHAKIANRRKWTCSDCGTDHDRDVNAARKDFLHKASAKIAAEFGLIIVGDISPKKIAQTRFMVELEAPAFVQGHQAWRKSLKSLSATLPKSARSAAHCRLRGRKVSQILE
jgi:hypothetical protein